MTQKTVETAGSEAGDFSGKALSQAIQRHWRAEEVSFHTPGHKGRLNDELVNLAGSMAARCDLTELPGLDDFTFPSGAIAQIEHQFTRVWGSQQAFLSLNGASAALAAAILAQAVPGKSILIPENCHRSAINALILSGLSPVFYRGLWSESWGVWQGADFQSFSEQLHRYQSDICAALVNSVEYSGALTDVSRYADLCRRSGIPLIVDEAHGAHRLTTSAVSSGASLVVHSLHKTLGGMTQTGVLHAAQGIRADACKIKSALNLLHSSSPNYLLLASLEAAIKERQAMVEQLSIVEGWCTQIRKSLCRNGAEIFHAPGGNDEFHILFRMPGFDSAATAELLRKRGVFAEAVLGNGILLMCGVNTTAGDISFFEASVKNISQAGTIPPASASKIKRPPLSTQELQPACAWLSPHEIVSVQQAGGRISADCIAPCPPGTPVIYPGQRIPNDIEKLLPEHRWLRVVLESPPRRD